MARTESIQQTFYKPVKPLAKLNIKIRLSSYLDTIGVPAYEIPFDCLNLKHIRMNDSQETFILNFGGGDVKEAFKNVLAFQDELEQGEAMISAMTHFLTTHPNIEGAVGEGVPYRLAFKIVPDRGGDGFLIESGFLLPAFDFRHREVAVNAGFAVNNSGYLKLFSGGKLIVGFVLPFRGVLFFDFQSAVIFNSQIMIDKYRSAVMREERSKFFLAAMMTDVLPKIIPSYKPSWTNGLEEAIEYKFEQCGE